MPLEVLLVLVVGGIGGIAVLLHLTGRSRALELTPDVARDQWLRHYPEDVIVDVTVSCDQRAALVRTSVGSGLLWSFGADTVARHLQDYDWVERPDGFEFQFHDFGTPATRIRLDDTERAHWRHMMEPA